MATRLQAEFANSRIMQNLFIDTGVLSDLTGIPAAGYRGVYREMAKGVMHGMTEAKIKYLLYYSLYCVDVTDEEKEEATRLLQLASTAFTRRQQHALIKKITQ